MEVSPFGASTLLLCDSGMQNTHRKPKGLSSARQLPVRAALYARKPTLPCSVGSEDSLPAQLGTAFQ